MSDEAAREWALGIWDRIHAFLCLTHHGSEAGLPRPGGMAIEVADSFEERGDQEVTVSMADGTTRAATEDESRQLAEKDAQDREDDERQREGDLDRWQSLQAAKYRAWEEKAMEEEMNDPFEAKRRKKVTVQVVADGGRVAATMVMDVEYKNGEKLHYEIRPDHEDGIAAVAPGIPEPEPEEDEFVQEARDEEVEVATQAYEAAGHSEVTEGLNTATDAGKQYYLLWKHGQLDDGAVAWRWGLATLDLFRHLADGAEDDQFQDRSFEEAMVQAAIAAQMPEAPLGLLGGPNRVDSMAGDGCEGQRPGATQGMAAAEAVSVAETADARPGATGAFNEAGGLSGGSGGGQGLVQDEAAEAVSVAEMPDARPSSTGVFNDADGRSGGSGGGQGLGQDKGLTSDVVGQSDVRDDQNVAGGPAVDQVHEAMDVVDAVSQTEDGSMLVGHADVLNERGEAAS